MPEEDRKAVGSERKGNEYDTYLTDHPKDGFDGLRGFALSRTGDINDKAVTEFHARGQTRLSEVMKLELARDFVEAGLNTEALEILVPLWEDSTWRGEDWHDLFHDLLVLLRDCAEKDGRNDLVVATTYELISIPERELKERNRFGLDLMKSLEQGPSHNDSVDLKFEGSRRLSSVAISAAFESKDTHVGEAIGCQLVVHAKLARAAAPIALSSVVLQIGTDVRLSQSINSADLACSFGVHSFFNERLF